MSSTAAAGGGTAAESQLRFLVDRCRMLEDSQAELQRQFTELLLEKENAAAADADADADADGDQLSEGGCIPGFFSGGSPYRCILESIGHAVHVCSPSTGEIVYWNCSAETLYGWKVYEAIGKRMDQLLVSEEHCAELQNILESLSFGHPWSGQFPFKRRSGETFMAMTTKSLLYEDGELTGVVTVSSDASLFNSINLEHQRGIPDGARGLTRGPRLNSKRIQWNPRPPIPAVPQIASSVSNMASKVLFRRITSSARKESAANLNNGADTEDDLLKKPVKLAEKFLERLRIGGNRGGMHEFDGSCEHDCTDDGSTSSRGTGCVNDRKENFVERKFSMPEAEGEYYVANRSMSKNYGQVPERDCRQCFDSLKPERVLDRVCTNGSEKAGSKIMLQKDGEVTDKAQSEHEERRSPSSVGSTGSHGSASSRVISDLASLVDCEIHWEDLQIGEEVGQGSFAAVHRGIWKGSDIAIKVYYSNDYNERTLQDYKKEIDIMKRLRHPNVLLFMGAVYSQERLAIVTEFLPRGSLFKTLHKNEQEIDIRRRMRMALDVVRGMNYLHHRNPPILHRDLKSSNLLVDRNWNVKVGDFGLSRLKNATLLATKSGRGTPQWMAPEVLRNEPLNEKSDVFSFGVVLWELVTQSIPWNHMNSLQVVGLVGFMDRRLDIPEGVDPEIASIIRDCWLSDPNQRPSFEDILQRMMGFLRKTMASDRKGLDS